MSVEMKLGRWQARNGDVFIVSRYEPGSIFSPWKTDDGICWNGNGALWYDERPSEYDLVRYLGPLEHSTSTASAEAGPACDQAESARKTLAMMRHEYNALDRWLSAYKALVAQNERTKDDLEEAIKMLEKEVEG